MNEVEGAILDEVEVVAVTRREDPIEDLMLLVDVLLTTFSASSLILMAITKLHLGVLADLDIEVTWIHRCR